MRVCIVGASGKLGQYMVRHVGDPILKSNMTRRVDFALLMVEALQNDELVREAPAIVSCQTPSALAHVAAESTVLWTKGFSRQPVELQSAQ